MKKFKWELIIGLALLAGIVAGAKSQLAPDWRDKLIRLHVVANSDSEADQAQKLQVRDAVLEVVEPILDDVHSAEEAKARLLSELGSLTQAANHALDGSPYTASVTLQREQFPVREYDTFTLPAGQYEALRVTIGEGEGHNWWCVVYPSLCFAATTEEFTELAVSAGLTEDEAALLTGQQDGFVLKWRIVELWQALLAWLRAL